MVHVTRARLLAWLDDLIPAPAPAPESTVKKRVLAVVTRLFTIYKEHVDYLHRKHRQSVSKYRSKAVSDESGGSVDEDADDDDLK